MAIDLTGYTRTFSDEFTVFNWAGASGNAGTWKTSYYNGDRVLWGNGETEFYSDPAQPLAGRAGYVAPHGIIADPSQAGDGILRITASTSPDASMSWGLPYVSGMVTTEPSFTQTYGYFEISAKVPDGQGLWPAFWLLPADKSHPLEFDALEYLGARTASGDGGDTRYWHNINSSDPAYKSGAWFDSGVDLSQAFHRYAVLWTPTYVAYFFDGQEIPGSRVPTPPDANKPMYMIANLAVGSNWTGPADPSLFASADPAKLPHFDIDSIQAWSLPSRTLDIGTGPDMLVFKVSQDEYDGNAQYTISVDGVQIGGTLTALAMHGSGLTDTVTLHGDWAGGAHNVVVSFLNDAYGGAGRDRNLYIEGMSYNGAVQPNGTAAPTGVVPARLGFTDTSSPAQGPATTTIGSGGDHLVLKISQDAYQGSAQYVIKVDGVQIGGTLTASALHGLGQTDTVDVQGNWAAGNHSVAVTFLNDLYGGGAGDRNLYVEGATYNGAAVPNGAVSLWDAGTKSIGFTDGPVASPSITTIGSGPDTLALRISQDAYQGSAQYTVKVDGVQIGGTLTAATLHGSGQSDLVNVQGDWAAGGHTVAVTFLNDLYGGGAGDRNLYVDGAAYNGAAVPNGAVTLWDAGTKSIAFTDGPAIAATTTIGSGADALVLKLSQDAFQGSAQYTVKVDGTQVGGTLTASALHGTGATDTLTVNGDWAAGNHTVTVSFLNDLYGGAAGDRNLYIEGIAFDDAVTPGGAIPVAGSSATLWDAGSRDFLFS